jgi:hypothetical protein
MKKKFLALVAVLSVALMPTTSSALTVGDAVYKVGAGVGGLVTANAALGFAAGSAYCAVLASMGTTAVVLGEPAGLAIAVPFGCGSVFLAALSCGSGYLSYVCFKEMLAKPEPEVVHVYHHNNDGSQN